jgi:hypothetical protein
VNVKTLWFVSGEREALRAVRVRAAQESAYVFEPIRIDRSEQKRSFSPEVDTVLAIERAGQVAQKNMFVSSERIHPERSRLDGRGCEREVFGVARSMITQARSLLLARDEVSDATRRIAEQSSEGSVIVFELEHVCRIIACDDEDRILSVCALHVIVVRIGSSSKCIRCSSSDQTERVRRFVVFGDLIDVYDESSGGFGSSSDFEEFERSERSEAVDRDHDRCTGM